jgi:hypothetical protein
LLHDDQQYIVQLDPKTILNRLLRGLLRLLLSSLAKLRDSKSFLKKWEHSPSLCIGAMHTAFYLFKVCTQIALQS